MILFTHLYLHFRDFDRFKDHINDFLENTIRNQDTKIENLLIELARVNNELEEVKASMAESDKKQQPKKFLLNYL